MVYRLRQSFAAFVAGLACAFFLSGGSVWDEPGMLTISGDTYSTDDARECTRKEDVAEQPTIIFHTSEVSPIEDH